MVIDRKSGQLSHHRFYELPRLLKPTDVLVFNNSKVIPARLYGHKPSGGKVEILLLRKLSATDWEFISHPGLREKQLIHFTHHVSGQVMSNNVIRLTTNDQRLMTKIGHTPLPPYIHSTAPESVLKKQYQTVYAAHPGSAAAPTAGLHFTHRLLKQLTTHNLQLEFITLHVGLGTFKSPTPDQIASGKLHSEFYTLDANTCRQLNQAKAAGRRMIAVGTTTCRVLESCANHAGVLHASSGATDIFIRPGYKFKFIDGLITNFHLPNSSLIMLVSAFASSHIIMSAYHAAIKCGYRFYSFGDACLII
jgi:S-adenosylmethionine:tRNA ribosyltransferase-isomerase